MADALGFDGDHLLEEYMRDWLAEAKQAVLGKKPKGDAYSLPGDDK